MSECSGHCRHSNKRVVCTCETAIDLANLSLDAVTGIMNGLNTSPKPFACEADRRAFRAASLEVVRRWEKLTHEKKLQSELRKLQRKLRKLGS